MKDVTGEEKREASQDRRSRKSAYRPIEGRIRRNDETVQAIEVLTPCPLLTLMEIGESSSLKDRHILRSSWTQISIFFLPFASMYLISDEWCCVCVCLSIGVPVCVSIFVRWIHIRHFSFCVCVTAWNVSVCVLLVICYTWTGFPYDWSTLHALCARSKDWPLFQKLRTVYIIGLCAGLS